VPVVPSYGSPDEYSLQQRQLTYQPTGCMARRCPARPSSHRRQRVRRQPVRCTTPWVQDRWGRGRLQRLLAAQRLWSSFVSGMNGDGFTQR
jgi:hypothetical protein